MIVLACSQVGLDRLGGHKKDGDHPPVQVAFIQDGRDEREHCRHGEWNSVCAHREAHAKQLRFNKDIYMKVKDFRGSLSQMAQRSWRTSRCQRT